MLAQFNYLSTVSGGGYVGSWLSAWLKRAHDAGPDGWPKVWASLAGPRPDPDEEPAQITWLRTYSNYLTPQLGLTSADTWAAIAIFLRNLILNWFVLVPVLAAVLLALKVVAIALVWISVLDPQRDLQRTIFCKLVILGVLGLLVALYFSNWQRPTHGPSRAVESTFLKWDLLPGCLAALLLTCALAAPQAEIFAKKYLIAGSRPSLLALAVLGAAGSAVCALSWIGAWLQQPKKLLADFVSWVIGGFIFGTLVGLGIYLYFSSPPAGFWPFTTKEILLLTVGVPWGIVSGLVVEMIFIGLTRDMPGSDTDREWLGRAAGWYLTIAIAWPVAMTLVFVGSILANHFYGELSTWITAGGAGTITALLGKSSVTPAKNGTATWTILSFNVILAIAAIVFAVALIVGLSALLDHILFGKPLVEALPHTVVIGKLPGWPGGIWVPIALGLVLFLGFVASWRVNINRFSLHALYRNRLIRGFLGASNLNRER
ncbi:MAG TPA: hypothetical protein VGX95_12360, partial [Xanthobacteraceae bacterium]|nr:hypothetical protein [Xanthobacteraceae bacterium]